MASYQYTRDLEPEDLQQRDVHVYTKKELRENWWDYHLKWVLLSIAAVLAIGYFVLDAFVFAVKTDYQITVISSVGLTETPLTEITDLLTPLLPDANQDGKVAVETLYYRVDLSSYDESNSNLMESNVYDSEYDYYDTMAGQVQMSADLSAGDSNIFIVYDPAGFQMATYALCYLDGTMPQDPATAEWEQMSYALADCPLLADTTLAASGDYYLVRRNSTTDETVMEQYDSYQVVWDLLTEGATPYSERVA